MLNCIGVESIAVSSVNVAATYSVGTDYVKLIFRADTQRILGVTVQNNPRLTVVAENDAIPIDAISCEYGVCKWDPTTYCATNCNERCVAGNVDECVCANTINSLCNNYFDSDGILRYDGNNKSHDEFVQCTEQLDIC